MTAPAQPAIGDYALLSDSQGSALVSRAGSIDWACLARFDAPSTFARLLDPDAGHWRIAPTSPFEVERRYLPGTMVLRTEFRTATGSVALTDAMPFLPLERGHGIGQRAPHAVVRLLEGIDGEVEVDVELAPRPEYGMTVPRWDHRPGGAVCRGGPSAYVLSCPAPLRIEDGTARCRVRVRPGERLGFVLHAADPWGSEPSTWPTERVRAWLYGTVRGWQSWSDLHQGYQGPYADLVHHSGRVLQALTYAPTGAIVAAPTTSLPEEVGGERNWDYRYTWVRDASLTLSALWVAACPDEVGDFFGFFVNAAGGGPDDGDPLQILYSVTGERRVDERQLDHLAGFRGSRPVRIGNEAWNQTQLDVYGELLDAAALYADRVGRLGDAVAGFLADTADRAAERWQEPDHGIWEMRGEPRHSLYSKLMCWVALDRAVRLADDLGAGSRAGALAPRAGPGPAGDPRAGVERVRRGLHPDLRPGRPRRLGAHDPVVGFLPGDHPQVRSTIRAVADRLSDERGLVHRYCGPDGLGGGEASFGICTYWMAHALALAGDLDGARERFEVMSGHANDVGLLAEEVDGATGEQLGNFPQAFTHIGLVNAAQAIAEAEGAGDGRR